MSFIYPDLNNSIHCHYSEKIIWKKVIVQKLFLQINKQISTTLMFSDSFSFFCRVWDKVISGSCKILVFVAVEILLTFKMKIIALNTAEKITQFLENVSTLLCFALPFMLYKNVVQAIATYCKILTENSVEVPR